MYNNFAFTTISYFSMAMYQKNDTHYHLQCSKTGPTCMIFWSPESLIGKLLPAAWLHNPQSNSKPSSCEIGEVSIEYLSMFHGLPFISIQFAICQIHPCALYIFPYRPTYYHCYQWWSYLYFLLLPIIMSTKMNQIKTAG